MRMHAYVVQRSTTLYLFVRLSLHHVAFYQWEELTEVTREPQVSQPRTSLRQLYM